MRKMKFKVWFDRSTHNLIKIRHNYAMCVSHSLTIKQNNTYYVMIEDDTDKSILPLKGNMVTYNVDRLETLAREKVREFNVF